MPRASPRPGEAEGKNLIVTQGLQNYLAVRLLATGATVGHMGVGTGATPVASTAGLPGEVANTARVAIGANSSTGSPGSSTVTAQVAATFSSGDANRTGNIGNIGLFGHSSATGSLFADGPSAEMTCSDESGECERVGGLRHKLGDVQRAIGGIRTKGLKGKALAAAVTRRNQLQAQIGPLRSQIEMYTGNLTTARRALPGFSDSRDLAWLDVLEQKGALADVWTTVRDARRVIRDLGAQQLTGDQRDLHDLLCSSVDDYPG